MRGIRRMLGLCGLTVMLLNIMPAQAQSSVAQGQFEQADCPFGNLSPYRIDCGWLAVPEDYANSDDRVVRLAVAIIRSKNPQKADNPIVYLAGGPGGAFVNTAPVQVSNYGLSALLAERDVILVDQRGMGLSQPSLRCVPYDSGLDLFDPKLPQSIFEVRVKACRESLEAQGIDYSRYDTLHSAADFAALRTALGYDQVNLYGTSWGTRLGLWLWLRSREARQ